jgi:hypothetical protein
MGARNISIVSFMIPVGETFGIIGIGVGDSRPVFCETAEHNSDPPIECEFVLWNHLIAVDRI